MPETLVEAIAALDADLFKEVVDCETRRRVTPRVNAELREFLPPPGPRQTQEKHRPPSEPRAEAMYEALQDPALVERWFAELTTTKRRIERQLASKASELISQEIDPNYDRLRREHHRWRAGVLRFLNATEDRIDVARVLTGRYHMSARAEAVKADRNALSERYVELVNAVERHRERNLAPDDVDNELYGYLP